MAFSAAAAAAKVESFDSWKERFDLNCANCKLFGWKRPDPGSEALRRCTGCRQIYYCGRECQEEHWRKVHKGQCKFFSGGKGLDGTEVHNKETCGRCLFREAAGKAVFNADNPNYICVFDPINPKAKSLLELEQCYPLPIAGSPQNRAERMVDLLQSLFLKVKLTEHPVFRLYPKEMELIAEELWQLKMRTFRASVIYPRSYKYYVQLQKLADLILGNAQLMNVPSSGQYQLWQFFYMVFDLLNCAQHVEFESIMKSPEKSLPRGQRQMSQIVRTGSFLKRVDQLLEVLERRVLSHMELATIVCDGKIQRACSTCNKEVTIRAVSTRKIQVQGTPSVMWHYGQSDRFSCGAKACDSQMKCSLEAESWGMTVCATLTKLFPTRCDHCFLLAPAEDVHRSVIRFFFPLTNFAGHSNVSDEWSLLKANHVDSEDLSFTTRSLCRKKNYCSKECFAVEKAEHTVCCNNLLEVNLRWCRAL